MKVDTFLFTHPIRAVIQEQNLPFVCEEVQRVFTDHGQGILFQFERKSECRYHVGDYYYGETVKSQP